MTDVAKIPDRIKRLLLKIVVLLVVINTTPCRSEAFSVDLDGNGRIGLEDAILCLDLMSNPAPNPSALYDINGDGKTGLAEAIYLLQVVAQLRSDTGTSDGVPTEAQIALLTNDILGKIRYGLSADDAELFANITATVSAYPYAARLPLEIPDDAKVTIEPSAPFELYRMYGVSAFLQGSMKGALWATLRAVGEKMSDQRSLSQAGMVLNALGRYAEALSFLKRAKYLDSRDDAVRINLAVSYSGLGRKSEAFREAAAAVAINPEGNVIREIVADMFMEESSRDLRNQFCQNCAQEIAEALSLRTTEEANAFFLNKQLVTLPLKVSELMALAEAHPSTDEVMAYILHPLHDQFDVADAEIDGRQEATLDGIMEDFQIKFVPLVTQLCDCVAANPDNGCPCLKAFAASVSLLVDATVPLIDQPVKEHLESKLKSHIQREIQTREVIVGTMNDPDDARWANAFLYKTLELRCINTALRSAYGINIGIIYRDIADGYFDMAEEVCDAIAAALEEYRRWQAKMEAERLEEQRLLEELRREYMESKKLDLKGEVCLGPIVCIGVDGTAVSLKVGSGAFAKFTADVTKFDVSIRVGVELGVGALGGGDISVGGTVSSTGTSFNVMASESRLSGTQGGDVVIWGATRNY